MKPHLFQRAAAVLLVVAVSMTAAACRATQTPTALSGRASALDRIKREKVIHAGYIKYPPFVEVEPSAGRPSGYFIDLMEQVRTFMGRDIRIDYEETAWGTMVSGIQSGRFDVVVSGIFSTIPRSMEVTFPKPLLYVGLSGVARRGDTRFMSAEDLKKPGLTIAVTAGEVGHEYAQRFLPDAKLIVIDTPDITRPMLEVLAGRADIGLADSMSCFNFVAAHAAQAVHLFDTRPLYVYATTVMIPRGDPDWKDFLDQAFMFLQNSGLTQELEGKYKKGRAAWLSIRPPFES